MVININMDMDLLKFSEKIVQNHSKLYTEIVGVEYVSLDGMSVSYTICLQLLIAKYSESPNVPPAISLVLGAPESSQSRALAAHTGIVIQCKPDILWSCISRNCIYRGRMLNHIFFPTDFANFADVAPNRAIFFAKSR